MNTVNAAGYLVGALLAPRWLARHDARALMLAGMVAAAVLMAAEALALRHPGVKDVQDKSRVIQENALRIRDILKRLERVRLLASKPYVAGERMLDLADHEEDLT